MPQRSAKHNRKPTKDRSEKESSGYQFKSNSGATSLLSEPPLLTGRNCLAVCLIALLTLVVCLFSFRDSLRYLFSDSSDEMVTVTEEFDNGSVTSTNAAMSGRPVRSEFGLGTVPGSGWQVTWTGTCESGALPLVRLNCFVSPGMENSLGFRLGDQVTTFPITRSTNADLIVASNLKPGPTSYSVTFRSVLNGQAKAPALALDRVVIGSRIFPQGALDANFFGIAWAGLVPLALFAIGGAFSRNRMAVLGIATIGAFAGILLLVFAPAFFKVIYYIIAAAFAAIIIMQSRGATAELNRYTEWILALVLVSLILPLRWKFFMANVSLPLPPDSADYMQIADAMRHPFDTRYREPLFPLVAKIWLSITHWSPIMMRCLTLLLALAEAFVVWKLARLFVKPLIAIVIMLTVVFNPALIGSSVQGLREEIFPLVLMLQAYFAIIYIRSRSPRAFWAFIILSGLVPLVRLSGLIYVLASVAIVLWKTGPGKRKILVSAAIIVAMIAPMAIYQSVKYGEPFYSSNSYVATFYRNVEFRDKPGFPTAEEVSVNPWAGERVSMFNYIFGMHPLGDVFTKSFRGVYKLIAGEPVRTDLLRLNPNVTVNYQGRTKLPPGPPVAPEYLLTVLFVVGLVALAFLPQGWLLLLLIALIQFPLAYLAGADLIGWRLTMNMIPVMLITAGVGLQGLWNLLRHGRTAAR